MFCLHFWLVILSHVFRVQTPNDSYLKGQAIEDVLSRMYCRDNQLLNRQNMDDHFEQEAGVYACDTVCYTTKNS